MNWTFKILKTKDKEEWNKLIENLKIKCIYYTPGYAEINEINTNEEAELFFYGNENNYVVYIYLKKKINNLPFFKNQKEIFYDISTFEYGGPAIFTKDGSVKESLFKSFLENFHSYCLKNNIISEFVRLHPFIENHILFQKFMPDNTKKIKEIIYVDLTDDEQTIFKNFKKMNKKAIRKAKRNNVKITMSNIQGDIKKFRELYSKTMNKWKARKEFYYSLEYFQNLFQSIKNNTTLFLAKSEEKTIVSSLLLHKFDIAYDYLRGADSNYLDIRPNNLLVYEIILWAKKQGYKYFVMGGGYKENDSIFRFKSLFSKKTKSFYRYSFIHNNKKYKDLCSLRNKHEKLGSVKEPDFFPYYRSP